MGKRMAYIALIVVLSMGTGCLSGSKLVQTSEVAVYAAGAPVSLSDVHMAKITQALNHFLLGLDTRSDMTYTEDQVNASEMDVRVRASLERHKVFDAPVGKLTIQQIAVVWIDDAPAALLQEVDESLWRVYYSTDGSARETLERVVDEALASTK